jgi:hypothetical protein
MRASSSRGLNGFGSDSSAPLSGPRRRSTDDAIHLVGLGGQHDDRHLRAGAQPLAQGKAVFARQHQVEHDEVDLAVVEMAVEFAAVDGEADAAVVRAQVAGNKGADVAIVFHDKDMRRLAHRMSDTGEAAIVLGTNCFWMFPGGFRTHTETNRGPGGKFLLTANAFSLRRRAGAVNAGENGGFAL